MALSTISPTTSPRLSSLRLDFVGSPYSRTVGSLIRDVGDDLLRIADEVARIKREFEGAVYVTVVRDPTFEVVLGRSNVRFRFVALGRSRSSVDSFSFVSCRSLSTPAVEMGRLPLLLSSFDWSSCDIGSFGRTGRQSAPLSTGFGISDTSRNATGIVQTMRNQVSYAPELVCERSIRSDSPVSQSAPPALPVCPRNRGGCPE